MLYFLCKTKKFKFQLIFFKYRNQKNYIILEKLLDIKIK